MIWTDWNADIASVLCIVYEQRINIIHPISL